MKPNSEKDHLSVFIKGNYSVQERIAYAKEILHDPLKLHYLSEHEDGGDLDLTTAKLLMCLEDEFDPASSPLFEKPPPNPQKQIQPK